MTLFQSLTIGALGLLMAWEIRRLLTGKARLRFWLLRSATWAAASLAIAFPNQVTLTAQLLGIRRGADLLIYVLCLAFVATTFFLYSRQIKIQNDITLLVRRIALMDAKHGGEAQDRPADAPARLPRL